MPNRALRHNIRHDVTVIRGHLDLLSEVIPESDHLEVIDERVANIGNLSEAARHTERLGEPDDSAPATFDLGPPSPRYVGYRPEHYRASFY